MAQFNLGGCYVVGEGVERDKAEAVKWLSKAAENADTREKAKAALKRIEEEDSLIDNAESPTGETEYEAGLKFYREKRYESAFKLFEKGTDRGHAGAQTYLALCYVYGRGVAKDSIKAFELFRKAAAQGNAEAMFNLGVCYQDGVGIKKDGAKAVDWYRKAADVGDPNAQFNLGYCYWTGDGVKKDTDEAVKWFRKAAEQGNALAIEALKRLGL